MLLASQLVPLVQLLLVVQDNLGLPADLAVLEYLMLPVVLTVPGDLENLVGQEDREDREDQRARYWPWWTLFMLSWNAANGKQQYNPQNDTSYNNSNRCS